MRPTELINWKMNITGFELHLTRFLGDITSRGYWRHRKLWFTSDVKHPRFNKLATWSYRKLESMTKQDAAAARHPVAPRPELSQHKKTGFDRARNDENTSVDERVA
jgi:hypothetical protein